MVEQRKWQRDRSLWTSIVGGLLLAVVPSNTLAQITGDGTLGSRVNGSLTAPCTGTCIITNGTSRGSNLFHSFRQFSLPNGDLAGFITTPTIQNVIVRITGIGQPFISNINGTIATSNPANFFLLNPNGIVFGPDTRLFNGGAFLATTAERLLFQDGTLFDSRDQTVAPVLTVSVPIGLQFGKSPGEIRSGALIGAGINSLFTDFALVGGTVTLDGSAIVAPGQRIEIAAVDGNSQVGLRLNGNNLSLNIAPDLARRDITLLNGTLIDVADSKFGGDVAITGRNIRFSQSAVFAGILAGSDNAATNRAGDIVINAAATLQLTQESGIINQIEDDAIGQGGNTRVTAANVQMQNGSAIVASTFGLGNAGNMQVIANAIALDSDSSIQSAVGSSGSGQGGRVTIQTSSLMLKNGGSVGTTTAGTGNAGRVQVTADLITLDTQGGIFGQVASTGKGRGGDITIQSRSLTLTNAASVSSNTFGTGNGGNITVATGSLHVLSGAAIDASTFGNGNGGNVRVSANFIALDGTTPDSQFVSGMGSLVRRTASGRGGDVTVEANSLTITNGANISASTFGNGNGGNVRVSANSIALDGTTPDSQFVSGIFSQVFDTGSGRGGDITVKTGSLTITNEAAMSASAFGKGSAGNLNITADSILLDRGNITARAASGNGANIVLTVRDLLLLRHGSEISTTAGTAQAGGDGGNITIRAPFIIGVLSENSDITANAFTGRGGNIDITTNAIFGLRVQPQLTPFSDITASSQFGINGNITLNTLNVDPNRGLVALPVNLTDPSQQIVQNCQPNSRYASSSFVVVGKGGLPPNPTQPFSGHSIMTRLATLDADASESSIPVSQAATGQRSQPIVEAKGWTIANGEVQLIAGSAMGMAPNPWNLLPSCPTP